VRIGPDSRDDPHEHGLLGADQPLEPVDVVEVVDDNQPNAGIDRES